VADHSSQETISAAIEQEIETAPNEAHKRKAKPSEDRSKAMCNKVVKDKAKCDVVHSNVVRRRRVAPRVDHKHTGKHSVAPLEAKAPVRVAACSVGKRHSEVGEAT